MLDGGRIVERGTHEQLLENAGRYATMLRGAELGEPAPAAQVADGSLDGDVAEPARGSTALA